MKILNNNGQALQLIIVVGLIVGGLVAGYYMQQAQLTTYINEKYYTKETMNAKMEIMSAKIEIMSARLTQIEKGLDGVDGKLDRLLQREH
jgi:hypothetical protein